MPRSQRPPAPPDELELEPRHAEVLELEYVGVRAIAAQAVYLSRSPAGTMATTASDAQEDAGRAPGDVDFIIVAVPRGTLPEAVRAVRAVLGHGLEEDVDDAA